MKNNLKFLKDKIVLITGGTGSFGKNFAKHLIENKAIKKVIVFSRDELKQFQMQKEFNNDRLRFFLGDVRDKERLARAFYGVDIVVHAAALKQVPTLEYNPSEAVKTNILGSQNVVDAAVDQGVEKVLLISTDKAVEPVNLYGATKLCAEKLFIGGNVYSRGKSKFSCVRYGNVLGSRGSIVELLLKNQNGTVHLTDERMTRFWIDFNQAFYVVLYAMQNMAGGEIFVPKVPATRVKDLFSAIAPKAKLKIIGVRPGEKIHETLLTSDEVRHTVELKDCYVIIPEDKEIHNQKKFKKFRQAGKKIPLDFCYRSDRSPFKMDKKYLAKMIKDLEKKIIK